MKIKRYLHSAVAVMCCLTVFAGCGKSKEATSADMSYTQADIGSVSVPSNVRVVGLGEASHGVSEYQQMKAEVFKALVANNSCRTFIIEGDFGGALKVNAYIHGGNGTAEEAVGEIGFAIYRTEEMATLVDWMRAYNETAAEENKLCFYGMDIQRFDNNKETLFSFLDEAAPALSEKYAEAFSKLTDEKRTELDTGILNAGKEAISELLGEMDTMENDIVKKSDQSDFDFARECAETIYACCDTLASDTYNATRDQYMFEKIEWFLGHGDDSILFINGHNGHIQKTSIAGYTCLGELLANSLGNGYYAIGTDAQITTFNSQNDNGFDVVEVSNQNELNCQFENMEDNQYFIDFSKVVDTTWSDILSSEQTIITLNVSLSGMQKMIKAAYTTTIVPNETFDGMIIFRTVSPTELIK